MYQLIIVIHVLLGLGIIGLILIQQGKGADAGAAFGSGSSGSVFGAQGAASFLSRTTAILAALFFTTSLGLAVLNSKQGAVYDLMSEPVANQNTQTLPDVPGSKETAVTPTVTEEILAVPAPDKAVAPTEEIKQTEVPAAETIKPIEKPVKK
ncbi:MAG: preprotein translocase subunit SecG [Methylovulum sp.]|nr:preprotein translocase subunit SecG [Methylovulum sp.]